MKMQTLRLALTVRAGRYLVRLEVQNALHATKASMQTRYVPAKGSVLKSSPRQV
jgi:hypothetical protein